MSYIMKLLKWVVKARLRAGVNFYELQYDFNSECGRCKEMCARRLELVGKSVPFKKKKKELGNEKKDAGETSHAVWPGASGSEKDRRQSLIVR